MYYNQPENRHLIHSRLRPVLFQEIPPDVDLGDSESDEEETINDIGRLNVTWRNRISLGCSCIGVYWLLLI